jgi:hypothetical protein
LKLYTPFEDIFRVWDLDVPAEDGELVKQLNNALTESSIEFVLSTLNDSRPWKDLEEESVDNLIIIKKKLIWLELVCSIEKNGDIVYDHGKKWELPRHGRGSTSNPQPPYLQTHTANHHTHTLHRATTDNHHTRKPTTHCTEPPPIHHKPMPANPYP